MLGEAENFIESTHKTETEGHKCSVCNGPDHRACGCEAAQAKKENQELKSKDTKRLLSLDEKTDTVIDAFNQIVESREAMLTTQRDIVEQLKQLNIILESIHTLGIGMNLQR